MKWAFPLGIIGLLLTSACTPPGGDAIIGCSEQVLLALCKEEFCTSPGMTKDSVKQLKNSLLEHLKDGYLKPNETAELNQMHSAATYRRSSAKKSEAREMWREMKRLNTLAQSRRATG